MNDKQKVLTAIIVGSLVSGGTGAITKIGLVQIPPLSFAFVRFFIASLCIVPFLFLRKVTMQELVKLVPVSILATFNIIFFVLGIKTTTATVGQLLYAGVPFLAGIFSYIFFKEELKKKKIIGILIGFIGVSVVIVTPVIESSKRFSGDLIGNILITLGVVLWSMYMVLSKKAQKASSPFVVTSAFILITTVILFPLFVSDLVSHPGWWNKLTISGFFSVVYVSIFATIISYFLNQYAIRFGGSLVASMAFYLIPLFAFIVSFILLGETLTSGIIIGGILSLLSIFIITH